jgi:hypothetical protein
VFPGNYDVYVNENINSLFSFSDIQTCLNRWNNVYTRFNLQAYSFQNGDTVPNDDRLATIIGYTIPEEGTLGMCTLEQMTSNGLYSENYPGDSISVDANINSTLILLDIDKINTIRDATNTLLTKAQKMKIPTHEIGHALKLSHTYSRMAYDTEKSAYIWEASTQSKTIMDQGVNTTAYPQPLDTYRLQYKWNSIT